MNISLCAQDLYPVITSSCHVGGEGSERCVTQAGARGVAVTTQRAAQPYEFAYDHVSGELGSQDDLFMCECYRSCLSFVVADIMHRITYQQSHVLCCAVLCCAVLSYDECSSESQNLVMLKYIKNFDKQYRNYMSLICINSD